jgi:hypothetical protein
VIRERTTERVDFDAATQMRGVRLLGRVQQSIQIDDLQRHCVACPKRTDRFRHVEQHPERIAVDDLVAQGEI